MRKNGDCSLHLIEYVSIRFRYLFNSPTLRSTKGDDLDTPELFWVV